MIYAESRYAIGDVDFPKTSSGEIRPTVYGPPINLDNISVTFVTVAEGDRFDTLARRYYGDPSYWWAIADANPEIPYPGGTLPVGRLVRVPR